MSREKMVWTRQHPAVLEELERCGIASKRTFIHLDKENYYPLLRRKIEDGWEQLSTCPLRSGDVAQAALWELRREWTEICDG